MSSQEDPGFDQKIFDAVTKETTDNQNDTEGNETNAAVEVTNGEAYLNLDDKLLQSRDIEENKEAFNAPTHQDSLGTPYVGELTHKLDNGAVPAIIFPSLNSAAPFSTEYNVQTAGDSEGTAIGSTDEQKIYGSHHLNLPLIYPGSGTTAIFGNGGNNSNIDSIIPTVVTQRAQIDDIGIKIGDPNSDASSLASEDVDENGESTESVEVGKKRRARPRKLPGAPKRARAPYIFFQQAKREEVKNNLGPNAKGPDVLQKCASLWRELDDETKEPYILRAQEDKARYDREMKAFRSNCNSSLNSVKMILNRTREPPRRGASAFLQYSKANRERMKREYPDAPNKELSKLLGTEWHKLSEEEKAPYQDLASQDANRYREEMAIFSASGGRSNIEAAVTEAMHQKNLPPGMPGMLAKTMLPTPDAAPFPGLNSPFNRIPFAGMSPPFGMPCGGEGRGFMGGFPYPGFNFMPGFGPYPGFYGMNPAAFGRGYGMGRPPFPPNMPISPAFDPSNQQSALPMQQQMMTSVLGVKPNMPQTTTSM